MVGLDPGGEGATLSFHILQICLHFISSDFLHLELPHILCLSEHLLNHLELETVHLENYTLRASYCNQFMKKRGVCIYVHHELSFPRLI
jgi:hypothetical protein